MQQRERHAFTLRQCQRMLDAPQHGAAIGQPGQRVGVRQQIDAPVGLDALADVAKRINAARGLPAAELRPADPLEHAATGDADHIGRRRLCGGPDDAQTARIHHGLAHALQHPLQYQVAIGLGQQAFGHIPQLGEAVVEIAHAARQIGHEDSVVGGFERGGELRHLIGERGLGLQLSAAVVHHDHERRFFARQLEVGDAPAHGHQRTVGPAQPGLRVKSLARAQRCLLPERQILRRCRQIDHRLTAQRQHVDAQQGRRRRVHGHHAQAGAVDQHHRIEQPLDQRAQRGHSSVVHTLARRWLKRCGQCGPVGGRQRGQERRRRRHAQHPHLPFLSSPVGSKK